MKICLDPGHGGADPGAVNGSLYEKTNVLRLALAVKPLLEARGIEVVMIRMDDDHVPTINQRCALANTEKYAYYLSLHWDAAGPVAFGISLWVYSKADQPTIDKAPTILDALLAVTPTQNRRVNFARLVLNAVALETLVVGVDIASEVQWARAFDWRGIELGKVMSFENSAAGFGYFTGWIRDLCAKENKTSVLIGAEPTGHYWFTLGVYL